MHVLSHLMWNQVLMSLSRRGVESHVLKALTQVIVYHPAIFLFKLCGHSSVLVRVASLMIVSLFLTLHLKIVHVIMRLLAAHSCTLPAVTLLGGLSVLLCMLLLHPLSPRAYLILRIILNCEILTAVVLTVDYDLVSIMPKIVIIENLILLLYLLVVRELCWIVHVYFSALIKIHVSWGVEHGWVSTSSSISIMVIVHLLLYVNFLSYNYKRLIQFCHLFEKINRKMQL